ncbi:NAD(P)-dependent oxidoreductase [Fructobacillus ficulneus]|uniref:D-lactate dehydrogenase n=1 Tax=Fructobacillus ficulneus TaxID=157463 RepID=A0A0K8MFL0_9LACO|nr:NAD(P)-dependent oxidoreductase [Fructobacillus ficulneus]GAO99326.1 D-lactate dehydrogenase [Fructobacillus ficulneus]
MSFKIISFGTRENEISYFEALNTYNYQMTYQKENLTADNIQLCQNHDGILLRANSIADKDNLNQLKSYGIKYVFTRTVGYNHIDLDQAKHNNQIVAYVPTYSPMAVANLAFSLAMMQYRALTSSVVAVHTMDFRPQVGNFVAEIQDLTVGIIGTGSIGAAEAQLWQSLGAKVLGYDVKRNPQLTDRLTYTDLATLLQHSDIVSLHIPHTPGQTTKLFGKTELALMKSSAILINTSRAEVTDEQAIIDAIKSQQIKGFATDVISNESAIFGKVEPKLTDEKFAILNQFSNLYPRVIITPHIGSYTKNALKDMITTSYQNFHHALTDNFNENFLVTPVKS